MVLTSPVSADRESEPSNVTRCAGASVRPQIRGRGARRCRRCGGRSRERDCTGSPFRAWSRRRTPPGTRTIDAHEPVEGVLKAEPVFFTQSIEALDGRRERGVDLSMFGWTESVTSRATVAAISSVHSTPYPSRRWRVSKACSGQSTVPRSAHTTSRILRLSAHLHYESRARRYRSSGQGVDAVEP